LVLLICAVLFGIIGVGDAMVATARADHLAQLKAENPLWDWERIDEGQVAIGMHPEEVRASWGDPGRVNRSVGSWGVHEQWVYGGGNCYLYFENGILMSWQD
jgi:hypothetical protein